MKAEMKAEEIAKLLDLTAHEEGGYYRQTFQTELAFDVEGREGSKRYALNTIYYLLTSKSPINYLHRNKSDIAHYFHEGAGVEYTLLSPEGKLEQRILGPKIAEGHHFQLVVPAGYWKAGRLLGGEYALISEAVAPGWDIRDRELATPEKMKAWVPELWGRLSPLVLAGH